MQHGADAGEELRKSGLRVTPKRVALLELLEVKHVPMTAEELHTGLRGSDIVTIYRNLQSLVQVGLVSETRFQDSSVRYEIHHEGEHHHHLVCNSCGVIEDVTACPVESLAKTALKKSKKFNRVESHALEFFGTCNSCS